MHILLEHKRIILARGIVCIILDLFCLTEAFYLSGCLSHDSVCLFEIRVQDKTVPVNHEVLCRACE